MLQKSKLDKMQQKPQSAKKQKKQPLDNDMIQPVYKKPSPMKKPKKK